MSEFEGSPLRQLMLKSVALKGELNLKKGWIWESTGFDEHALALKREYTTLVDLRGQLEPRMAAAPAELQEAFGTLETEMGKLEAVEVKNESTARDNHKTLVTAQVNKAKGLKDKLDAFDRDAASKVQAATKLKDDQDLMRARVKKIEAWGAMDIGTAEIQGGTQMAKQVLSFKKGVLEDNRPLTVKQGKVLEGFDDINKKYEAAATAETERKETKAKAKKQQEDAAKVLSGWAAALGKTKATGKALQEDSEIAEGVQILGGNSKLKQSATRLDKVMAGLNGLDPGRPEQDKLDKAVQDLDTLGPEMRKAAAPAVAARDTNVEAVLKQLEREAAEPGKEPRVGDVKKLASAFPGLVDEIFERYRSEHYDTQPQVELRAQQKASKQGEADRFTSVGPWMAECGLGGSARPGSSGPVFMDPSTGTIGGFKTHFSQYLANASVPVNGVKATFQAAKAALFAGSGAMCPHLTQERVEQRGSPDNARLFVSGLFLPGNIPQSEKAAVEGQMKAALDKVVGRIDERLRKIVA